jgi:hypothetical protein
MGQVRTLSLPCKKRRAPVSRPVARRFALMNSYLYSILYARRGDITTQFHCLSLLFVVRRHDAGHFCVQFRFLYGNS